MTEEELPLCECGCRKPVAKLGNRFIYGHNNARLGTGKPIPEPKLCECGCGEYALPGNRFIVGHANRGRKLPCSTSRRIAITQGNLKEKDPLLDGWESKKITTNKDCSVYLGGIVEQLLSNMFKEVKVMPHNNSGFDFICGKNLKIDAKGGVISNKKWNFFINKNRIADYFLCVGFNSRKDLTPIHLWLIPGKDINYLNGITIYKVNLGKWSKYEQPLNKILLCCNEMKS